MDLHENFLLGLFMPFIGTTLGAGMVFFLKRELRDGIRRGLLGFASGVMMAASVWSLLLPAIEMSEAAGKAAWVPCLAGFLAGVGFMVLLDGLVASAEGAVAFAITLHNIPEGMAVGVALAGMGVNGAAGALALSFGIAVQNIPEGAVISLPLGAAGGPKGKAFVKGFLSGAVEPVASVVTAVLVSLVTPILPYILAFAAGAMIYVVVEELIPDAASRAGTIGAAAGFAIMMTLDVALG